MFSEIADRFKTITNSLVNKKPLQPYWIEIITKQPECMYYFGPFDSHSEAKNMQGGYIEDLMEEKAIGISVKIKRCLPLRLTITAEELLV
jgi:hypothetical protein